MTPVARITKAPGTNQGLKRPTLRSSSAGATHERTHGRSVGFRRTARLTDRPRQLQRRARAAAPERRALQPLVRPRRLRDPRYGGHPAELLQRLRAARRFDLPGVGARQQRPRLGASLRLRASRRHDDLRRRPLRRLDGAGRPQRGSDGDTQARRALVLRGHSVFAHAERGLRVAAAVADRARRDLRPAAPPTSRSAHSASASASSRHSIAGRSRWFVGWSLQTTRGGSTTPPPCPRWSSESARRYYVLPSGLVGDDFVGRRRRVAAPRVSVVATPAAATAITFQHLPGEVSADARQDDQHKKRKLLHPGPSSRSLCASYPSSASVTRPVHPPSRQAPARSCPPARWRGAHDSRRLSRMWAVSYTHLTLPTNR